MILFTLLHKANYLFNGFSDLKTKNIFKEGKKRNTFETTLKAISQNDGYDVYLGIFLAKE